MGLDCSLNLHNATLVPNAVKRTERPQQCILFTPLPTPNEVQDKERWMDEQSREMMLSQL